MPARVAPPQPSGYGLQEEVSRGKPKLSPRISYELKERVENYLSRLNRVRGETIGGPQVSVQQLIIEGLELRLAVPIEAPTRPGDAVRGGNMLSWQAVDDDGAPGQEPPHRRQGRPS